MRLFFSDFTCILDINVVIFPLFLSTAVHYGKNSHLYLAVTQKGYRYNNRDRNDHNTTADNNYTHGDMSWQRPSGTDDDSAVVHVCDSQH